MPYPRFFTQFPEISLPFDPEVVSTRAVGSDRGLVVFFDVHRDVTVPQHSHGDQWGTVISGEVHLTVEGEIRVHRPGDDYFIAGGQLHSAMLPAGTQVMEVFAEHDRYPIKPD